MTGTEAIAFIHSTPKHRERPDLSHFRTLLALLGNPQDDLRFIHVAGTNGKGSVCAMTASILQAAGYRVGLYTSPFILLFNERIQINGKCIPDDRLGALTEKVRSALDGLTEPPTEFELITAVAFLYYQEEKVDCVVLEVGLGGRLDPTNVINNPLISVISGIALDHMEVLGNTVQKIAAEKAGIIKDGCPSLYGGEGDAACRVLKTVADLHHSPFSTVDRSRLVIREMTLQGTRFDFGTYQDLYLPLLGVYQPKNATTVLTAVEILNRGGMNISEQAIRDGLKNSRWEARFEVLNPQDPIVIFDGCHNPQGVDMAVKSMKKYFPEQKVNILSGVMADKDFDGIIETFKPIAKKIYAITPNNPRALSASDYAQAISAHRIPAQDFDNIAQGFRTAVEDSKKENLPLICLGSLYLYRELTDNLPKDLLH